MVVLAYILLYLILTGLLITTTARLSQPLNLIVDGVIFIILFSVSLKLFGFGLATIALAVWMILVVAGLYALRLYFRHS